MSIFENWAHRVSNESFTLYHGTSEDLVSELMDGGLVASSGGFSGRAVYSARSFEDAARYALGLAGMDPRDRGVVVEFQASSGDVLREVALGESGPNGDAHVATLNIPPQRFKAIHVVTSEGPHVCTSECEEL